MKPNFAPNTRSGGNTMDCGDGISTGGAYS
jgi:hypothetical protein